jgi:two-component system response regulator AtoC
MSHAGIVNVMSAEDRGPPGPPEVHTEMTADVRPAEPSERRLSAYWDGGSLTRPLPRAGTLTIGRSTACDVRVDHASVSRKHAVLHLGPVIRVEDAGSANGTRVGGRPATSGAPVAVAPGEVVEIGQVVLVIQGGDARPAPSDLRAAAPRSAPRSSAGAVPTLAPPSASPGTRPNESPMQRVERLVRLVAAGNIHVVVCGETGVGKQLVAERIHAASRRSGVPLVSVDAASLDEQLLERELFGEGDRAGLFEAADGGTLLLDEVSELPLGLQAKLVRVIERGQMQRVGTAAPRRVDIRFIASSNRDLRQLVAEGAFREDLYFRLNGITIEVPPLRDRKDEVATIASVLLAKACAAAGRPTMQLGAAAIARLESYEWPGNIRELKNALDRAVLLSSGAAVDPEALPAGANVGDAAAGARLQRDIAAFERQRIVEALEECAGNQTKAAARLGISRRTLVSRLGEYNLPRPRGGGGPSGPK